MTWNREGVGPATVLVAEDDPSIRFLIAHCLERKGLRVLTSSNGAQALETVLAVQGRIDLLVSDVTMPVLGGVDLASRLRETTPDLPVLFLSGHDPAPDLKIPGSVYICKPFSLKELGDSVERLLGLRRAS